MQWLIYTFLLLLFVSHKVRTHFEDHDLSDASEVYKMADSIVKAFPNGIDILVNNAGNNLRLTSIEYYIHVLHI